MMTSKTEAKNGFLSFSGLDDDELKFNKNLYKRLLYEVAFSWKIQPSPQDSTTKNSRKVTFCFIFSFLCVRIKLEMCLYGMSHAGRDNFNEVRSYVSNVIFHSID